MPHNTESSARKQEQRKQMIKVHRNRLGNVNNSYQGSHQRVLCVCSAGLLRSPTLAHILSAAPYNFNTRSVGTSQEYALFPIDLAHVAWADLVIVMDYQQKEVVDQLCAQLKDIDDKFIKPDVVVFDVPDDYGYMDPGLVELLTVKCEQHFAPPTVPAIDDQPYAVNWPFCTDYNELAATLANDLTP